METIISSFSLNNIFLIIALVVSIIGISKSSSAQASAKAANSTVQSLSNLKGENKQEIAREFKNLETLVEQIIDGKFTHLKGEVQIFLQQIKLEIVNEIKASKYEHLKDNKNT